MHRFIPILILLASCSVGSDGPASPGSPSAEEAARVRELAQQAAEIEALSKQLTVQVDDSRRAVAEGRSTPEAEIPKMQALVKQIEEKNSSLQAEIQALEARAHERAGDVAWPIEPEAP